MGSDSGRAPAACTLKDLLQVEAGKRNGRCAKRLHGFFALGPCARHAAGAKFTGRAAAAPALAPAERRRRRPFPAHQPADQPGDGPAPVRGRQGPEARPLLPHPLGGGEDFSYLRDPAKSNDLFDPLKFVRLDRQGRVCITFSGEERFRYEHYTKNSLTFADPKHQNILYFRHLYGADVHLGENVRAFASLNSGQVGGHNYGTPASVNRNDLVIQQAFGEVMGSVGGAQAGLRVGRQEVWLGSGLLFSNRESTNIHQALDGLRGYFDTHSLRVDAFAFDNVIHRYGVLQDSTSAHQNFWGVYATQVLPVTNVFGAQARLFLDPTYIGTYNRTSTFRAFAAKRNGTRLVGACGARSTRSTSIGSGSTSSGARAPQTCPPMRCSPTRATRSTRCR